MPQSKDSYSPPSSDEFLYRLRNPSLWNCQSYNLETTMLTEAISTITEPKEVKKT